MVDKEMVKKLQSTHSLYDMNIAAWKFYKACYDGIEALKTSYIKRHERESEGNYKIRLENLYGFGYSEAVVDLFNLYLFEKDIISKTDVLDENISWDLFVRDCDLYKSSFGTFILGQQRETSIYGHVGILVDKPNVDFETKEEEIQRRIYPYISAYSPLNILDWKEERDEYNRPFLSYLKLKEDNGVYRLWYPDKWELWEIQTDNNGVEAAIKVDSDVNPLNEIPFVWFYNLKSNTNYIGLSDISKVSYIDFSIVRNLSQGEEIIDYSAFPMMRKPRNVRSVGDDDDVGPTVVLTYDKEYPESKPDWLEAKCKEPIDALLLWLDRKVREIYRSINSGGIASTEVSADAKSGIALSMEFRLLNRKLVGKGENVANVKKEITRLWLKWENEEEKIKDITYMPPDTYDVKNLAVDLENAIMGKAFVNSDTFDKETQKIIAKRMLPNTTVQVSKDIEEEIDSYQKPTFTEPTFMDGKE